LKFVLLIALMTATIFYASKLGTVCFVLKIKNEANKKIRNIDQIFFFKKKLVTTYIFLVDREAAALSSFELPPDDCRPPARVPVTAHVGLWLIVSF